MTFLEIALGCALKGVIFEVIHQRRQRSLLRQKPDPGARSEHAADAGPLLDLVPDRHRKIWSVK
jgi:hypothetical protein